MSEEKKSKKEFEIFREELNKNQNEPIYKTIYIDPEKLIFNYYIAQTLIDQGYDLEEIEECKVDIDEEAGFNFVTCKSSKNKGA